MCGTGVGVGTVAETEFGRLQMKRSGAQNSVVEVRHAEENLEVCVHPFSVCLFKILIFSLSL
jgi:hypothetical protein